MDLDTSVPDLSSRLKVPDFFQIAPDSASSQKDMKQVQLKLDSNDPAL